MEHGTDIKEALRFARQMLGSNRTANRQIILITDGEPTAATLDRGGRLHSGWGSALLHSRIVHETLKEVKRCTQSGIKINTFMLGADFYRQGFIDQLRGSIPAASFTPRPIRWATTSSSTTSTTNASASAANPAPPLTPFWILDCRFWIGDQPKARFSGSTLRKSKILKIPDSVIKRQHSRISEKVICPSQRRQLVAAEHADQRESRRAPGEYKPSRYRECRRANCRARSN